jgi:hypothetical protein
MLEFLIGCIFAMLGGRVFQQTIGFPTGTNYAPLLASLLICSFEADFLQGHFKKYEKNLARSIDFTLH